MTVKMVGVQTIDGRAVLVNSMLITSIEFRLHLNEGVRVRLGGDVVDVTWKGEPDELLKLLFGQVSFQGVSKESAEDAPNPRRG